LLHLVGSSILLYLIDDTRSNKNQVYTDLTSSCQNVSHGSGPIRFIPQGPMPISCFKKLYFLWQL